MPRIALDLGHLVTPETRAHEATLSAQARARAALAQTDWLIVRQIETGKPVQPAVLERRARARALLGGQGPNGGAAVADGGAQAPDGAVHPQPADGSVPAPDGGSAGAARGAMRFQPKGEGGAHGG